MTKKFVVPRDEAEMPTRQGSGEDYLWPEGLWAGEIEAVRINIAQRSPAGNSGPHWLLSEGAVAGKVASIQLGSTEPLGGQEPAGGRKFFDERILLEEVYPDETVRRWDEPTEDENWMFEQTRRRLTNLALAIGAVEESPEGVSPSDGFEDVLEATTAEGGGLHGTGITFEVFHKKAKKADPETGKKKTYANLKAYYPST